MYKLTFVDEQERHLAVRMGYLNRRFLTQQLTQSSENLVTQIKKKITDLAKAGQVHTICHRIELGQAMEIIYRSM